MDARGIQGRAAVGEEGRRTRKGCGGCGWVLGFVQLWALVQVRMEARIGESSSHVPDGSPSQYLRETCPLVIGQEKQPSGENQNYLRYLR